MKHETCEVREVHEDHEVREFEAWELRLGKEMGGVRRNAGGGCQDVMRQAAGGRLNNLGTSLQA